MARFRITSLLSGLWLSAGAFTLAAAEPGFDPIDCPEQLEKESACFSGVDSQGAWYLVALPPNWKADTGKLIVHAHGGPSLGAPHKLSSLDDLERFAAMVNEGYAWAGSSYRRGGFGVTSAAEDSDRLRELFWKHFGRPAHTFLHGQSWGANIALKTVELYNTSQSGRMIYDGVLLTNGLVAGGSHAYDFRADLRAVYQYFCANHPEENEPSYPLWQGLPLDSNVTVDLVRERVNQCTGVDLSTPLRTPEQAKALNNILSVIQIPEYSLQAHMAWATFTFRDLVMKRLNGKNPFTNRDVVYRGSDDDQALNLGVARFSADADAVNQLHKDADLSGNLIVPTLSIHAIDDPIAFVEMEHAFHAQVVAAGQESHLLQVFTTESNHQRLSSSEYAATLSALQSWVDSGRKASINLIDKTCKDKDQQYAEGCFIHMDYAPMPLSSRVAPRTKSGIALVQGMQPPLLKLDSGIAAGLRIKGLDQFLGVPYAAPPTGAGRWEKSSRPPSWNGIYPATRMGARCPQTADGLKQGKEREDCLYLNIYRPSSKSKKARAIYLYVHGGGAVAGSANDVDATRLALAGDLIVVTANYRLGALGFMNSEAIAAHSSSGEAGNYALDDIQTALGWINRNAKALGGNPDKITLGGESAGGTIICPLLIDSNARQLFQQAIISSDDCLHDIDTTQQARERAEQLSKRLGCDLGADESTCLRGKTAAEIISAGGFAAPSSNKQNAFEVITQRHWKPLPVLIGANRDEGRIAGPSFNHFSQATFEQWLARLVPAEKIAEVVNLYSKKHLQRKNPLPYQISDIITDSGMRGFGGCTIVSLAKAMARTPYKKSLLKNVSLIYFYEFSDPDAPFNHPDKQFDFGSAHSVELSYLWPDSPGSASTQFTSAQRKLSEQMLGYWANFINTGNPNSSGLALWPSVNKSKYMLLKPNLTSAALDIENYQQQHHCDFWDTMPWIIDRGEPTQ